MRKSYLRQVVNLVFFLILQVFIPPMLSLQGTCFMYIGFLLFLPWARHNMIWQLLLSFGIGLLVDIFYQGVGIHACAAVFLLYFRNLFLYFFIMERGKQGGMVTPTFTHLGAIKFGLYTFFFTVCYHVIAFALDHQAIQLLFVYPSRFLLSIVVSNLTILLPSLVAAMLLRIYAQ